MRAWVAGEDETGAVAALIAAFRDHLGESMPPDEEMLASVRRIQAEPDSEFLLAAPDEDAPAAVLQLRFRWSVWKSAPDAWIEDLYVDAAARRHGLGQALLDLAFARARQRGARRVELDCLEGNAPARALYERNGFSAHSKGGERSLLLGRKL